MNERINKAGWKKWRFDQMAYEVKDRIDVPKESGLDRYVGLEHLDSESLKIWRWGSTSDVQKQKLLFKSGDIIFGRRNAYLKRIAVADFNGVCSAHAMVLRAQEEVVLPEFLPFFMQTDVFWESALRVSAGSMSPTINWRNIAKEEFALPPLDEQRRIVELLKSADRNIIRYDSLYKSILVLKKSIVNHYMEMNGDSPSVSIKQIAEINPETTRTIKELDDIKYIDISSVSELTGVIEDEIKSYTYKEAPSRARRIVKSGDIIISTVRIYLKSYALISEKHDGYVVSTGFCVLRPKSNMIFPELLFAFIKSENFIGHMDAYSTGTNYPSVSVEDIANYNIPLPPLQEQKEILKKISSLYIIEKRLLSRKGRLTNFKKKVLDSL